MFFPVSVHNLLIIFIAILSLVLILICIVLLYSFYRYKTLTRIHQWSAIIDKKISDAIVYAGTDKSPDAIFNSYSEDISFRNLFLEKLVASKKKFSGSAQTEINNLFIEHNLQKEALNNLKKKQSYLIAGGIQEITAMNLSEYIPSIRTFLTHPSSKVYHEAQYAMVAFQGFKGLDFLTNLPHKISDWQQLRLLRSINSVPESHDDLIKEWLGSSNTSVAIFTLRLLRKFQILSLYSEVKKQLEHSSIDVRIQVVRTLQGLENSETVKDLIEAYTTQPSEVQLEIIKAIKLSNDRQCRDFLKIQLQHHDDVGIKIAAAESLLSLGFREDLLEILKDSSSSGQLLHIIRHALQDKTC